MSSIIVLRQLASRDSGATEFAPGDPTAGVAGNRREIIGVSVFSIVLAITSVAARLFFRRSSKLPWLADDWLIVIAAILTTTDASLYLACLLYGFGEHIYVLLPYQLVHFFELVWATFLLYGAAVSFVKFSVLALYNRIFARTFHKSLIALGVLSVLWWILITLITIFQCIPIQKNWDQSVEGACVNYLNVYISIQVLNIVLDTAILVLPVKAVMKVQMSRANKISVAGTFGLGGLAVIFAIFRLYVLVHNREQTDITFSTATGSWSLIEPSFEIFCACLPCMTPLVKAGRVIVTKMSSLSSSLIRSDVSSQPKQSKGDSAGSTGSSSSSRGFTGGDAASGIRPGGIRVSTSWTQEKVGGAGERHIHYQQHYMLSRSNEVLGEHPLPLHGANNTLVSIDRVI